MSNEDVYAPNGDEFWDGPDADEIEEAVSEFETESDDIEGDVA